MKQTRLEDFLRQQLKNPKFRTEYEALEDEFTLAKEIIALRIKNKLTQKQLAQQIGTSQPAIARIESGSYHNVSLSFLRRLADALGAVPEIHLRKKGSKRRRVAWLPPPSPSLARAHIVADDQ
jgi:transcriptional regulator with XRE-family HTH domain